MAQDLRVTLLGTGTPNPNPARAGASYLFHAGDFPFLIDCGPGALLRLTQSGKNPADIDHVFFTHFHLDHYADFGQFVVARWMRGTSKPLKVYGPEGLKKLVDLIMASLTRDIGYRQAIRTTNPEPPVIEAVEIEQGFAFEHLGLSVRPFDVKHFPIEQPFGYRVETAERKIVFSGDTCPTENLIRHARDADVLIHECVEFENWNAIGIEPGHKSLAHTDPGLLGDIATQAKVGACVTTHMLSTSRPDNLHRIIRQDYSGTLIIGQDLMTL